MPAIDFNADDHEPRNGFEAIPAGRYKAVITESEEKSTRKGDGSYLQFTFEVLEGDYKGRKLWARMNINNPNSQAVEIAKGELSALCRAVNVKQLRDTQQLHDLPVVVKVNAKKGDDGETRNEIKGYESTGGLGGGAVTSGGKPPVKPTNAPWTKGK